MNFLLSEYDDFLSGYLRKHPPIPKKKSDRWSWTAAAVDAANKLLFSSDRKVNGSKSRLLADKPDSDTLYKRLEDAWELYRMICFHGNTPLILRQFAVMVGIGFSTLRGYGSGDRRPASGLAPLIQSFKDEIESDLLSRAIDCNDVGAIFVLKSHYGYNDKPAQKLTVKVMAPPEILPDPEEQQAKIDAYMRRLEWKK